MTRMFVTAVPGLGPMVSRELGRLPGNVVRDSGFDGRSDVVLFETTRESRSAVFDLGVAEDVFVEVGRTLRAEGDRSGWIAGRLWRPERAQRALSVWAEEVRPLTRTMTFRVIARVLQERSFVRTDLRRQLTRAIQRDRPRWRAQDPAQLEVWVSEYAHGRFVAGLRLSDERMRQHGGRVVEREGALRPTVARAMVLLAGEPGGVALDPCCGSGTILRELLAAGWEARGSTSTLTPCRLPSGTLLTPRFGWVTPAAWSWPTRVSGRVCPICHSGSSTASKGTCTPGCGRCSGRWPE
jgi:23S rRNA G2445 N2-methylase RlmL